MPGRSSHQSGSRSGWRSFPRFILPLLTPAIIPPWTLPRSQQYACLRHSPFLGLSMTSDDRREFQRLQLAKPILSQFGDANALILDIGVGGALLEHHGRAESGEQRLLRFRWKGEDIEFTVWVIRSRVVRQRPSMQTLTSHPAVRFLASSRPAAHPLNGMIATSSGNVLAAHP